MASQPAIKVENLGKCYHIYDQPHDRLLQMMTRGRKQFYREYWALRDISFSISPGTSMAIIGRNGSGKSTLLQLICGTLNPTQGNLRVNGRVAALLELGSGFNPEFTGRENIFLNGAVLGLTREQIEDRYERIAAFADIGDFIEQPVKTYSSGMALRLAFSVIAHVDADVLVVDEALAVGDAVFTQKCMRFIRAFQERGTLLFVSHDMGSVQNLCESAIWLHQGRMVGSGPAKTIAKDYLKSTLQEVYGDQVQLEATQVTAPEDAPETAPAGPAVDYGVIMYGQQNLSESNGWKTGAAEILKVELESLAPGAVPGVFAGGETVRVTIQAQAHQLLTSPILGFLVRDRLGQDLFGENTLPFTAGSPLSIEPGQMFHAQFEFKLPMLPNGQYSMMASVADGDLYNHIQHHWLHDAYLINVASTKVRWGLVGISFDNILMETVPA